AGDDWHDQLHALSKNSFSSANGMVSYFDQAFHLRKTNPDYPVLLYAIGLLFALQNPEPAVQRVAESCISQAILSEPGCAQKAFALLTYWEFNGAKFDRPLVVKTVDHLSKLHESRGLSSDIAWALAFAIQNNLLLSKTVGARLSRLNDDGVAVQALHAHALGLLPSFKASVTERALRGENCDGPHWLLLYEGVRQGYFSKFKTMVTKNLLMGQLLAAKVAFYRTRIPAYAMLIHPGGAPEWVVSAWVKGISRP